MQLTFKVPDSVMDGIVVTVCGWCGITLYCLKPQPQSKFLTYDTKSRAPSAIAHWVLRPISLGERLLKLLREKPQRPISELATHLYDDNSTTGRGRVRALLAQLRKAGAAKHVGRGRWEAVERLALDVG